MTRLLSHSVKTDKGTKDGYGTAVMYLAPFTLGGPNICPLATAGCSAVCLHDSGMLGFRKSLEAQLRRTAFYHADRAGFIAQLEHEIALHVRACDRVGLRPAVRLNGTSDLRFEVFARGLFDTFANVVFYDYTKIANRRVDDVKNYTLTFSLAETARSWDDHIRALDSMNVAVVFSGCGTSRYPKPMPRRWNGRRVIDGDLSDARYLDRPRRGAYVGLRAKGRATRDDSGFVFDAWTQVAA